MSLQTVVGDIFGYGMSGGGGSVAFASFLAEAVIRGGNYVTAANTATVNGIHNLGVAGVVTAAVGCAIFYINYQRKAIESLDRKFNEKLEYSFNQF